MNNRSKKLCVILLLILIIFSSQQNSLFAQNDSKKDKLSKEFFLSCKDDFLEVLVSPKEWRGKTLLKFSAIVGAGLLLYALDGDIHRWSQDNQSPLSEDFFKFITHFGDGYVLLGLMTALYASGEVFHRNSLRKTALLSLESWLTAGVIVRGIKIVSGRARPWTGESSHSFHPLSLRSRFNSFPSGHASSAFAVATVIAEQSEKAYIDILAYSIASLVAVSRVHIDKHWPSDILIGSAIGYFVAEKICSLDKDRDSDRVRINLQFSRQRRAVSITFSF
ncbi:MAG: phosphatase PAP2 family protein [Candidatus Aminicenantes bacterium]|nr:phosphatase PAP2 family protein [Candidatus Aminicenantes bacterium]